MWSWNKASQAKMVKEQDLKSCNWETLRVTYLWQRQKRPSCHQSDAYSEKQMVLHWAQWQAVSQQGKLLGIWCFVKTHSNYSDAWKLI